MRTDPTRTRAGFGTIEAIMAVVLLALVTIGLSRGLLNNFRSYAQMSLQARAVPLADMALEQYGAWAQMNFDTLHTHNFTEPVRPEEFFNSTEPLGFGTLKLKTFAQHSPSRSSCTVTVTVVWSDGGVPKEYSIQKIFTESMKVASGGYIDVLVKGCSGGSCRGLVGFEVSAPAAVNGNSTAITNAEGRAVLKGVRLGTITVTAKSRAASPYFVSPTDPKFVRAYLVKTGPTTYEESATDDVTVTMDTPGLAEFDMFVPASDVRGRLVLHPDPTTGVTDDSHIGSSSKTVLMGNARTFQGNAVNGQFKDCGPLPAKVTQCSVETNSSGEYVFSNVIPGMVKVYAKGNPGMTPWSSQFNMSQDFPMPEADNPEKAWGYTNSTSVNVSVPGPTGQTPGEASVASIALKRLGFLRVAVVKPDGLPVSDCQLFVKAQNPLWSVNTEERIYAKCNASGIALVPNLFGGTSAQLEYSVWVAPTPVGDPSPHNGFYALPQSWTVASTPDDAINGCFIQTRTVTGARQLSGILTTDGTTPIANKTVWLMSNHIGRFVSDSSTTVGGAFTIRGIAPEWVHKEPNGAVPLATNWSSSDTPLFATFNNVRFYGTLTDLDKGAPAEFVRVRVQLWNEVSMVTADGAGSYDVTLSTMAPVMQFFSFFSGSCTATECVPTGPWKIGNLMGSYSFVVGGWDGPTYATMVKTDTSYRQDFGLRLRRYRVYGTVSYGGSPVAGVRIEDSASTQYTVSKVDGTYEFWPSVIGRSMTEPGRVQIRIPQQTVKGAEFDRQDFSAMNVDEPVVETGIYRPIMLTSPAGTGGI
jgi:hypothetical protein